MNSATETPKIVVTFPTSYTLGSTCTFSGTTGQLSSSLTCTATNSGADSKYEITNPFGGSNYATSATALSLTLGLVKNPNIVGSAGTFTLATFITVAATDYAVDTGTLSPITITAGSLISPSVTPSSTVAYATGVTYSIGFTTQHAVVTNGIIDVIFPSGIIISDTSAATAGCKAGLGGAATTSTSCTVVSSTQIKFTALFSSASFSGAIVLEIPGIRNPRSLSASSSFSVTTTDNSANVIDTLSAGFTVSMASVLDLQDVSIENTATDEINGAFDSYQVFVTAQTPTANGDRVVLRFPTSMSFPTSSASLTCTAGSNVVAVSCAMTSSTRTITATISSFTSGSVASGTQFDFTINTLGNPTSLAPFYMQSVNLVDSSGSSVNAYVAASSTLIQNTQAAAITSATLSQSTVIASSSATYNFRFTPINAIPQNAKIELIYPSTVTVPTTITCSGLTGIPAGTTLD